jgi:predicted GNAT family N-acyltransferase
MSTDQLRLRRASAQEVLPLRGQVLRPGLPPQRSIFPNDQDEGTWHLVVQDLTGQVLACSTWFAEAWAGRPTAAAWRLRGMATAEPARGKGLGGLLLTYGLDQVAGLGAELAWCNARISAVGFYQRYGFATHGPQFVGAQDIPHYVMWRALP